MDEAFYFLITRLESLKPMVNHGLHEVEHTDEAVITDPL